MDTPAGFLKAQIDMAHCSMTKEQTLTLFDYGMIDHIIFHKPEDTFIFGEKCRLLFGISLS